MVDGWSYFLLIFCDVLEKDREEISETVEV
jgi:hypothetical protein